MTCLIVTALLAAPTAAACFQLVPSPERLQNDVEHADDMVVGCAEEWTTGVSAPACRL